MGVRRDNCFMARPTKVELKISVRADDVARARRRLDLTDDGSTTASIWFCDQPEVDGTHVRLKLFERDVIVRFRHKHDDDSDTTIKLRRPEPLRLPNGWRDKKDLKVEGDWSGKRQVSASLVSTVDGALIDEAGADRPPLSDQLFSRDQRQFVTAILRRRSVELTSLRPLGPIDARRWEESARADLEEEVGAEQWVVDDQVFLELSMRVKYENAEKWQRRFNDWAGDLGLDVGAVRTTKTQAVLEHFARRLS